MKMCIRVLGFCLTWKANVKPQTCVSDLALHALGEEAGDVGDLRRLAFLQPHQLAHGGDHNLPWRIGFLGAFMY